MVERGAELCDFDEKLLNPILETLSKEDAISYVSSRGAFFFYHKRKIPYYAALPNYRIVNETQRTEQGEVEKKVDSVEDIDLDD